MSVAQAARSRILIVEDSELNRDLLVQLLEDDYIVLTAGDGAQGISAALSVRPDLILMDLSLPVIDGWDATRRIRALPELKNVPIIAVSAHAMPAHERRARECGCSDYLTKPIDETVLLRKIRSLLDAHKGAQSA